MKVCAICSKPLPSGRSKYCSDKCYFASKTVFNRRRYDRDPAFVERQKAAAAAWAKENRERRNATARERYARQKAAKLAAVLAKRVRP